MKVEKIHATIAFSQDTGKGAWKRLEIGAEATIDAREQWQAAQAHLYADLAKQFKALWSQNGATPQAQEAPVVAVQLSGASTPPPSPHWCEEHQQEFKLRTGQYGEFYSHQIKGTREWCNESKK